MKAAGMMRYKIHVQGLNGKRSLCGVRTRMVGAFGQTIKKLKRGRVVPRSGAAVSNCTRCKERL